ncbi:TadE/TadG family type IV pilus assembly protein [Paenibacillus sp. GCM10027626]|uniref:TadE/TadG family type IV pilus assembly protein n=1 Tax=Paenibacillus sp. GCM10027626 TaxID=3273411 RepID=UPI0036292094
MRRQEQSDCHTASRRWRREAGSIVVEAALILPIVMLVIIFFISMIRLTTVQMALHGAASQVVRQTASHMYPVALAAGKVHKSGVSNASSLPLPGVDAIAEALERWMPEPAGPLFAAALQGDWQEIGSITAAEAGRVVLEPLLRRSADDQVLDPERLKLHRLTLPDLPGHSDAYVRIEVEYTFPLALPFTRSEILLREQAEERVWLEDTVPAKRGGGLEQGDGTPLQIVSLVPDPLRPGRKAILVLRTTPGQKVSLAVQYKSGTSKAKHLGETVADEHGYAEWSWLVSGNTTPGIWELLITAENGASVGRHFVVEKLAEK